MGKRVTLTVITDLYSDPDKNGKEKLIKRGIKTKMNIDTDHFDMCTQIINTKGDIVKNKCRILVRDYGPIVVNHSWEEINDLKNETKHRTQIKGFRK